jgi:hypothetical protein
MVIRIQWDRGLTFGVNQLTMNTETNFQTKPDLGWNTGFICERNFYDDGGYGLLSQFSENNFSVATRKLNVQNVDVNYKLASSRYRYS